ncbi:hydrogenase maturation protease [Rhodococcus oxybenzonivorans]|uniref:Hydrogenase maturation protease n=1 Tax=Rhodococcus oxybenzonivorans TaxID=1990687 RepID=A0A2S2BT58_9NOCA|nr:hydrogenase maturation protease [Rhodococcus oxybenzonivorans]AWK71801.1 hydrogenase maturation protease [Rhodococcus oxybenzonivorans]
MTAVVLGVGNENRRDDGVGPAVARAVAARAIPNLLVTISDGDPATLLDAWADMDVAVLVDAIVCDPSRPGTVHRFDSQALAALDAKTTSTHGLGLTQALRLGAVLGRLPRRWVLYAVEVADIGYGRGLSSSTREVLEPVTSAVLAEVAGVQRSTS